MNGTDVDVGQHLEGVTDLPAKAQADVGEYFGHLQDYTRMVVEGYKEALLVHAPAGLGKSHTIEEVLESKLMPHEYEIVSGYVSPMKLHEKLYENRHKVIFFDDVEGILDDDTCLSTLKAATWGHGTDNRRLVSWESGTGKIDEKMKTFEMEGNIIICVNDVPDDPIFDSLKSRCLYYELDFGYQERIKIINEIAKVPYEGMEFSERLDVAMWIEEATSPAMNIEKIDLRYLIHCFDLYRFLGGDEVWQERALELLDPQTSQQMNIQNEKDWIIEMATKDDIERISQLQKEYEDKFGKTERTFYNRVDSLKEDGWESPL